MRQINTVFLSSIDKFKNRFAGFSAYFLLILLCCGLISPADFPTAILDNGSVKTELYLPDSISGYYRGTRFDWAGVIPKMEYKGHQYFSQWFDSYDPKLHDAIMGPVEEFTVLGFDEASVGGEFLKIGVGTLSRPDDKKYSFFRPYDIKNYGTRKIKKTKNKIEFTHEMRDAAGYSYIYKKTVKLLKGKSVLVLEHNLKNTGKKAIETSVYNHNFFTIDQEQTGPNIKITFPFDLKAEGTSFGTIASVDRNAIIYSSLLPKKQTVFTSGLQGLTNSAKDYDIRIENIKTRAGVRITGDQPIEKCVFWACSTTSCPEPYIKISAKPGDEMKWKIQYELFTF